MPDEAWIGATPQRCAKAASERIRWALSPAATSSRAAVWVPTPCKAEQTRRRRFDEASEFAVEAGAVGVDVEHAATKGLHGQLGGIHHWIAGRVGTQCRGCLGQGVDGDATEPFPQVIRSTEAEMTELVEALGARLAP